MTGRLLWARHDDEQTLLRVDEAINKTYTRRNGAEMSISRICWDTGGIDPTIVYERSKKHGLFRVIPIKGASVYGKPVASMPRKRNTPRGLPYRNRYGYRERADL